MKLETAKTQWYVFYTYPRAEKKVYLDLVFSGYDVFLPQIKTLNEWKNRQRKWIDKVLFPGYIFVNIHRDDICRILMNPKVVSVIQNNGIPSVLNISEIERIQTIIQYGRNISIEQHFLPGIKVRIMKGPFIGYEGILLCSNGKTRLRVEFQGMFQCVAIDISTDFLQVIDN